MKKKLDFSKLSVQSFVTTLNPNQDYKLKGGNTGDVACTITVTQAYTCIDCSFRCETLNNLNCTISIVEQSKDLAGACVTGAACPISDFAVCQSVGCSNRTGPEGCC